MNLTLPHFWSLTQNDKDHLKFFICLLYFCFFFFVVIKYMFIVNILENLEKYKEKCLKCP